MTNHLEQFVHQRGFTRTRWRGNNVNDAHSRFCTCSRDFSISDFISKPISVTFKASPARPEVFESRVFASRFISCSRKSIFLPTSPSWSSKPRKCFTCAFSRTSSSWISLRSTSTATSCRIRSAPLAEALAHRALRAARRIRRPPPRRLRNGFRPRRIRPAGPQFLPRGGFRRAQVSSPPVSNRTYNNRVACFLKSIGLKNILSFKDAELPLGSLNVLIGPNGAGKSNLIDVIGLLQAAPGDLNGAILRGGGAPAWVRKGEKGAPGVAAIECEFVLGADQLAYSLEFSAVERGLVIEHERLKRTPKRSRDHRNAAPGVYFERSVANMQFWDPDTGGMASRKGGVSASGSLFSMLRSPIDKTPITPLGMELERIRVYRSFNTGMDARARNGTGANVPKEFLDDGGDNLAAVLHEMRFDGSIERVNQYVRRLADQFEDVRVRLDAGNAQTYLKEKGIEQPISAVRLSD